MWYVGVSSPWVSDTVVGCVFLGFLLGFLREESRMSLYYEQAQRETNPSLIGTLEVDKSSQISVSSQISFFFLFNLRNFGVFSQNEVPFCLLSITPFINLWGVKHCYRVVKKLHLSFSFQTDPSFRSQVVYYVRCKAWFRVNWVEKQQKGQDTQLMCKKEYLPAEGRAVKHVCPKGGL